MLNIFLDKTKNIVSICIFFSFILSLFIHIHRNVQIKSRNIPIVRIEKRKKVHLRSSFYNENDGLFKRIVVP